MGRASRRKWERRLAIREPEPLKIETDPKRTLPRAEFSAATIIALALFLLSASHKDTNAIVVSILLVVIGGLLLHPILSLEWVKVSVRRRLTAWVVVLCVMVAFGNWIWPLKAESKRTTVLTLRALFEESPPYYVRVALNSTYHYRDSDL